DFAKSTSNAPHHSPTEQPLPCLLALPRVQHTSEPPRRARESGIANRRPAATSTGRGLSAPLTWKVQYGKGQFGKRQERVQSPLVRRVDDSRTHLRQLRQLPPNRRLLDSLFCSL